MPLLTYLSDLLIIMADVAGFLRQIRMTQYIERFYAEGFDTLDDLMDVWNSDL
jgi:hypothetical protein